MVLLSYVKKKLRVKSKSIRRKSFISVSVGGWQRLPFSWVPGLRWTVINNEDLIIKKGKWVTAQKDKVGRQSRGKLACRFIFFYKDILLANATIVPWAVNNEVFGEPLELGRYTVMGEVEGRIFCTDENNLYEIVDGRLFHISELKWKLRYRSDRPPLIKTPVGWFLRIDGGVVYSSNLTEWSLAVKIPSRAMFQHLDFTYDEVTRNTYIFAAEYSTDSSKRHGVYRGVYDSSGEGAWSRVFEFFSSEETKKDPSLFPSARHIHVLTIDKLTGHLWVTTGDSDRESGIFYSEDYGESFKVFALGSQEYRTLMLHFTHGYLYWNMDTHLQDQKIFRVSRSCLKEPLCKVSSTVKGLLISKSEVILNKEVVAVLPYGAQWYGIAAKNKKNEDVILMSASPESQVPGTNEKPHRDWSCRIFLIVGLNSEKPSVKEVFCSPPVAGLSGKSRSYNRIDPRCTDGRGNFYFMAHNSLYEGALKVRLRGF